MTPVTKKQMQTNEWTPEEKDLFSKLQTPDQVQAYLDSIEYSDDPLYRCPREVIRDRKAHCFDGALFAACAFRQIGMPPLILDLRAANDDDHILAIFKRHNCYGAVAKSNFVGLRFREPIFRNFRELVLSYFEDYYNMLCTKSLREYSLPVNLQKFDNIDWMTSSEKLECIASKLDKIKHFPLLTSEMEKALVKIDDRSMKAGMVGVKETGIYIPAPEE